MSKEITQAQIDAWKAEHGEVSMLTVGEKKCYLKSPTRQTLGYAGVAGQEDPMAFNDVILNQCWLGGDEEIKTNTGLFFSASKQISKLINIVESDLVKL